MNSDKNITASFTGHREYRHSADGALLEEVRRLYGEGYRIFLCGMARGFDLAAGECITAIREELPEIKLKCIIPFRGQEQSFSKRDRERHQRLVELADEVIILADGYHSGAYHARNDFLVENASAMIAYYNGTKGGTHYTIHRALRRGLRIVDLCLFRVGELFENLK